jgi:hypothetical protein
MPNNIVRTNAAGTVASASVATVNTIAERDNNGDSNFRRVVGNSAVVSSGCLAMLYATKTADYTATDEVNGLISVTVGAANRTVTLPPAATLAGMVVGVKRLDATEFTLTVDGTGSETIDGQASTYVNAQYETAWFLSDGSNWFEVMRTTPWSVAAKSASFSAFGAKLFNITTGAGVITVTLPAAALMKGQVLWFKKVDTGAGSVTLTTNGTETVDGTNDPTGLLNGAGAQWDVLCIVSDGSNWHKLSADVI